MAEVNLLNWTERLVWRGLHLRWSSTSFQDNIFFDCQYFLCLDLGTCNQRKENVENERRETKHNIAMMMQISKTLPLTSLRSAAFKGITIYIVWFSHNMSMHKELVELVWIQSVSLELAGKVGRVSLCCRFWKTDDASLNPETRILKQLVIDGIAEANMTFSSLMGARRVRLRIPKICLIG